MLFLLKPEQRSPVLSVTTAANCMQQKGLVRCTAAPVETLAVADAQTDNLPVNMSW
jgi:hypothetical protein